MIISSTIHFGRAIIAVMAFFFCSLTIAAAEPAKQATHQVYFSLADEHGFPLVDQKTEFDCSDKIYTVLELSDYELGKYALSIVWIDPYQKTRERTEYDFHVRGKETRLWSWLSLKRATGAGMLQWLNPAAGLEEFIGPWSVEVRVNNRKIDSKQFEVSC